MCFSYLASHVRLCNQSLSGRRPVDWCTNGLSSLYIHKCKTKQITHVALVRKR